MSSEPTEQDNFVNLMRKLVRVPKAEVVAERSARPPGKPAKSQTTKPASKSG